MINMKNTLLFLLLGLFVGVGSVSTSFAQDTLLSIEGLKFTDGQEEVTEEPELMEVPDDLVLTDGQEETPIDDAESSAVIGEDMSSANSVKNYLCGIFLIGIAGVFIAFFMPSIFTMVPLTLSFFTKKSGSKAQAVSQALLYGIFIIVIYVALGMLITVFFGAEA